jgi:endonuclease G, mitochondrial
MRTRSSKKGSRGGSGLFTIPPYQDCRHLIRFAALPYLRTEGITSVGIGYKSIGKKPTGEISVQFTVRRKLSRRELRNGTAVPLPDEFRLPDGRRIRVDVVERKYRLTHVDPTATSAPQGDLLGDVRRSRLDPIRPGASVGRSETGAGTITAIVYGANNTPYLLSNWHVIAGPHSAEGDPIAQPGPLDESDETACRVGHLVRRYLGLAGDGALCSIEGRGFDASIIGLDIVPKRVAVTTLGDAVVKSGRTTGITHGVVIRSNVVATVAYPQGDREVGGFEIQSTPAHPCGPGGISEAGDSGSLWLIDPIPQDPANDIAVGIQVCAAEHPDEQKEIAFACNLHSILEKLGVSLVRSN